MCVQFVCVHNAYCTSVCYMCTMHAVHTYVVCTQCTLYVRICVMCSFCSIVPFSLTDTIQPVSLKIDSFLRTLAYLVCVLVLIVICVGFASGDQTNRIRCFCGESSNTCTHIPCYWMREITATVTRDTSW